MAAGLIIAILLVAAVLLLDWIARGARDLFAEGLERPATSKGGRGRADQAARRSGSHKGEIAPHKRRL